MIKTIHQKKTNINKISKIQKKKKKNYILNINFNKIFILN